MGSVNLDNTGSGSAITLSSDGTSLLLDGTAIGGGGGGSPDLYAENYDGTSTLPSATNTNAVAIGVNAKAKNEYSVAIGRGSLVQGGSNSVAIGDTARCNTALSLSLGNLAVTAVGLRSTALTKSYASGVDSLAAAIASNSSSYGATGANSIAMGSQAKATGAYSASFGPSNNVTGDYGAAYGRGNTVSSSGYCFGSENTSSASQAFAFGQKASSNITGKFAFASSRFSSNGDGQTGIYVFRADTTSATAEALTTTNGAATTNNQVILPNNSAYSFSGTIVARQQAADGSNYASWEIKGALLRDANAASTVLGNGIVNKLFATAGASAWAIALTADTTNGGLKIEATGAAATDIRWVATVNTSEVTYA